MMITSLFLLSVLFFLFIGSLLYSVNPVLGSLLFVVALLTLLIGQSLEFGLLMTFFTIPFDRCFLILKGLGLTVSKVFIGLTLLIWLVRAILTKDPFPLESLYNSRTSILILCYLLVSILTAVQARDLERVVEVLVRRINVIVFYFFLLNLIRSKTLLRRSIQLLLLASFFITLVGLYELGTGDQVLPKSQRREELYITSGGASRIQGCAGNPDFHAAILVMLLPFLLTQIQLVQNRYPKIALYILLVLYCVNILGTNARLGLLGMVVAFSLVFLLSEVRWKIPKLMAAFAVLLVLFGLFSFMPEKFTAERYTGESGLKSLEYRLGWIIMAWEMVKRHPVFGVGTGNFYSEYHRYIRTVPDMVPRVPIIIHNGVMQIWAENGTVGLIIFLLFLLSVPLALYRSREGDDREMRGFRIAIFTSFVIYVICIGVIPALEHEIGWISIAFAVILENLSQQRRSLPQEEMVG
ncbi:MAG: O-antigen ligase family protein [Nitrospinota bacterium]|nr:MAG: O-antigen ligase family protein [Nitrospinota bacterium]